ncbi:MAG TPA: NAD(P)H-dependent oxidoreductase [Albitalea sp.]|nr:NAD(P)H-dependent oxidoreductase [Albitalea sp.]
MAKRILIIEGHPDPGAARLGHALAEAYAEGAAAAGHSVQRLQVAQLDFPLLRSKADWESGAVPAALEPAQHAIRWAEHLVLIFPLWLGGMPALLKAFLEQVARPGFALGKGGPKGLPAKLLRGRSARIVVTMGMPAFVYRWYFFGHSLRSLKRNILGFVGVAPVRQTIVGSVDALSDADRNAWLARLRRLGQRAV